MRPISSIVQMSLFTALIPAVCHRPVGDIFRQNVPFSASKSCTSWNHEPLFKPTHRWNSSATKQPCCTENRNRWIIKGHL